MISIRNYLLAILFLLSIPIQAQESLTFATYAYADNNRIQNLEPLAQWLSQHLGIPVNVISYPSVKQLIQGIQNDSVDIAMMNTSGYLVLQRKNPGKAKPLVNLLMANQEITNYGGCIITLKKSGLTRLQEAIQRKSSTLSLVAPSSTSGNLVPRLLLNKEGIQNAEETFDVRYAGTHAQVVQDILKEKALIGGCGCAEVEKAQKEKEFANQLVVISSFNDIPLGPIVSNSSLDVQTANKIQELLLHVHQSSPKAFTTFCDGWTEFKSSSSFKAVDDHDYDPFRSMFGDNMLLWKIIE